MFRKFYLMQKRRNRNRIFIFTLLGAFISAVATIFLTPKTGKQMRQMASDSLKDATKKVNEVSTEVQSKVKDTTQEARARLTEVGKELTTKFKEFGETAKGKVEQAETKVLDKAEQAADTVEEKAEEVKTRTRKAKTENEDKE